MPLMHQKQLSGFSNIYKYKGSGVPFDGVLDETIALPQSLSRGYEGVFEVFEGIFEVFEGAFEGVSDETIAAAALPQSLKRGFEGVFEVFEAVFEVFGAFEGV